MIQTKEEIDIFNYLEKIYEKSFNLKNVSSLNLNDEICTWIKTISDNEETNKAVYTVLVTSLVYKSLYPTQDIRYHQKNMDKGYSGRSFDTKYITPFMKFKFPKIAMRESGWLTRSLEQLEPYDLKYPGHIPGKKY